LRWLALILQLFSPLRRGIRVRGYSQHNKISSRASSIKALNSLAAA